MKKLSKSILAGALSLSLIGGLAACTSSEYDQRKAKQSETTLKNSQALENLQKRRDKENDPNKIRYIYLVSFGKPFGYYVAKGNITSNAAQMAPEEEVIRGIGGDGYVLDSASDDNTYGGADPGIFFFTANGTMISTDLNYIQSDQPIQVYADLPELTK